MDFEYLSVFLRESVSVAAKARAVAVSPDEITERARARLNFTMRETHLRRVLAAVAPDLPTRPWRLPTGDHNWSAILDDLTQGVFAVTQGRDIDRALAAGEESPRLDSGDLHPLVWDAAKSYWRSEHYRAAVDNAAGALDAAVQHLIGRRDLSGTDLMAQAFSLDDPKPGAARLRLAPNEDSKSARSLRQGALQYAQGVFLAIRNPAAHDLEELETGVALERLAALSVLARWIEDAEVVSHKTIDQIEQGAADDAALDLIEGSDPGR